MTPRRVLVTGAAGFIGINLVQKLVALGHEVTALDLPGADYSHIPKDAAVMKADLSEPRVLAGKIAGFHIAYHLAARTDLDGASVQDYAVNFEGTKHLIDELGHASSADRFVMFSTQLVVGLFDETRFIDEDDPYRTATPYGESKIRAEQATIQLCRAYHIPYTIIRPTSVYGPHGRAPYREFFRTIRAGTYFHIGKAANLVSMAYVENVVDLAIMLGFATEAENEVYFASDFHPYTMREFADTAAAHYGRKIRTVPYAPAFVAAHALGLAKRVGVSVPLYPFRLRNITSSYCYDIQKSVNVGYRPQYDLTNGIPKTLDWYESHGDR